MASGTCSAFVNSRNRTNSLLHLRKAYSRSSHLQKCTLTSIYPQISFLILVYQITRSQPAVAEDPVRFCWVVVVARTYRRSVHDQLPDIASLHCIALIIND